MKELISVNPSQFSGKSIPTVNARDLHEFLESKKDFSTWIKDRIDKYGFMENQDYVTCSTKRVSSSGTKHAIDYHLTLDMAKELSMVERNDKGKQARQYFLDCERRALSSQQSAHQLPTNYKEALVQLLEQVEENERLQETVRAIAPKADALDRISASDGMENITNTAKALQIRPKELFNYLSSRQWIYRRPGGKGWIAYQNRIQQGLLAHKVTTVQLTDGSERMIENVLVTPKGLAKLAQLFSVGVAA